MRAVVLRSHGGPEVLTIEEVDDPVVGPEEILVDVAASALNRADLLQRMGLYAPPIPLALEIPGLEHSGTVAAVGERVTMWRPGDLVMGIVSGGAHAERLAVHERQAMAVPAGIELHDAAAIPEVFITAWDALVLQGGLTSGRWALVHAGASGVGTAAIQLAKALGANVAVTCSAGKIEACRALGADLVFERSPNDWLTELQAALPSGVHTVLDVVGGDEVDRNIAAIAVQGRIVQVGVMGGGRTSVNVGALLPKRATLTGTVLRARPLEEKIAVSRRFATEVLPLFASGRLVPVIFCRFGLSEIADAHVVMDSNANIGKIVVTIG
jgi:putative PIG3 family NAD(P)H quinone oxidoreductase